MESSKYKKINFFVILILLAIVIGLLLKPFGNILVVSAMLAILFRPLAKYVEGKIHRPSFAALTSTALVAILLFVPVLLFGKILLGELVQIYDRIKEGNLILHVEQVSPWVPHELFRFVSSVTLDANVLLGKASQWVYQNISDLASNLATLALSVVLTFFTLFYLFKDGHRLREIFVKLSPIPDDEEALLFEKISSAVVGIVKSTFLIASVQACAALIGFALFGLPEPFFWAVCAGFASLIPSIGTSIVVIPAVAYLIITGHVGAGVGLLAWGAVVVGLIDNAVGPFVIGKSVQVHPVLVLFSVLGGVALFGFIGLLLGPILMATFLTMLEIYLKDYKL